MRYKAARTAWKPAVARRRMHCAPRCCYAPPRLFRSRRRGICAVPAEQAADPMLQVWVTMRGRANQKLPTKGSGHTSRNPGAQASIMVRHGT